MIDNTILLWIRLDNISYRSDCFMGGWRSSGVIETAAGICCCQGAFLLNPSICFHWITCMRSAWSNRSTDILIRKNSRQTVSCVYGLRPKTAWKMLPQGDAGDRDAWARSDRVSSLPWGAAFVSGSAEDDPVFRMPETKKALRFSFSSLDLPETTKTSMPVVTGLEGGVWVSSLVFHFCRK
jgi:hypothetical protein